MPNRVRQFWIPALVTLLLAMVCLALIQLFGPNPWVANATPRGWRFVAPTLLVYIPVVVYVAVHRRAGVLYLKPCRC